MGLYRYLAVFVRRWPLIVAIIVVDVLAAGYLYHKAKQGVGWQACVTLYVSDVTAPSITAGPSGATDLLLAGETAANFFGDDILDIAQSSSVAAYISTRLRPLRLPSTSAADINGSVSGSRKDRTVNLCATNPNAASARAIAAELGAAMVSSRARFMGTKLARRTFVSVISPASVGPAPSSKALLNFVLRVALGVLVALGAALLWDALDPRVRDSRDVERALGSPVLARVPSGR